MSLFAPFPLTVSSGGSSTPTPDVAAVALTFTPGSAAVKPWQRCTYFKGSGLLVTWTPTNDNAVNVNDYEVRAGVAGSNTYDVYTVANGKLTFNPATESITHNPTAAESAAWSSTETFLFVLWRIDEDNNQVPEGVSIVDVEETLWP
jgi:hypothetical protein